MFIGTECTKENVKIADAVAFSYPDRSECKTTWKMSLSREGYGPWKDMDNVIIVALCESRFFSFHGFHTYFEDPIVQTQDSIFLKTQIRHIWGPLVIVWVWYIPLKLWGQDSSCLWECQDIWLPGSSHCSGKFVFWRSLLEAWRGTRGWNEYQGRRLLPRREIPGVQG